MPFSLMWSSSLLKLPIIAVNGSKQSTFESCAYHGQFSVKMRSAFLTESDHNIGDLAKHMYS